MRIEIEIPKEFEEHFNQDKFEDSLNRLYADVHLLAGNYERELAEMLIKAFRESKPAYDIDKVVAEFESDDRHTFDGCINKRKAIEIVKKGVVSDDVCEWKSASDGEFIQNPHTKRLYSNEPSMKNVYCNTCGKKIKVVE